MAKRKAREDSGLVVYVDIVGFSSVSVENQRRVVTAMDKQVVQPILTPLGKGVVILPTGDGMAACFPVCKEGVNRVRKVHLVFLAQLLHWSGRHNLKAGKPVRRGSPDSPPAPRRQNSCTPRPSPCRSPPPGVDISVYSSQAHCRSRSDNSPPSLTNPKSNSKEPFSRMVMVISPLKMQDVPATP